MPKEKIWNIGSRNDEDGKIRSMADTLGICFPTACLLYGRGYKDPKEASDFIRLESELFHDPFLLPDMDKAVKRIKEAIQGSEKIKIYGDYDVDGVTSVSLLYLYLTSKGAEVSYYIPNRASEGYGVNCEAIDTIVKEGNTLIITVDTGVTAIEEAKYCAERGCDMIITDHHECRDELPEAVGVINPKRADSKYPFSSLAGVGVAFKLVTAVECSIDRDNGITDGSFLGRICREYADLAALGTVADVMPLHDENRLIVSMGLSMMDKRPRAGIKALLEASDGVKTQKKKTVTSSVIGYSLAPKINAAGRIASAETAVELFLTESDLEAQRIAAVLNEINKERQNEENKIVEELRARIDGDPELKNSAVMVLENEGWHHGVIGIVSSRVTEKYGKPSILISLEDGVGKGSGRSIKGLNLVEALGHCSDLLEKYGGHELAAGLTVKEENLCAFRRKINEYAIEALGTSDPEVSIDIDCELYPSEITLIQASELELLEPCGTGNPTPTFACFGLIIEEIIPLSQGKHSKIILAGEGKRMTALMFGTSPDDLSYCHSNKVDIAFRLNINEYMGNRSEQILIRDIRLTAEEKEEDVRNFEEYESALKGEALDCDVLPIRADFVSTYLHLKRTVAPDGGKIGIKALLQALNSISQDGKNISYAKLRLVLDILNESGVISLTVDDASQQGRESFHITVPKVENKVDLEKSCLYKQLMNPNKTNIRE